jgi:hypothetical protein
VPEKGSKLGIRDEKNEKRSTNIKRAKTNFLDIGQSNQWDYMATFTSGTSGIDYASDIRSLQRWLRNWNTHHDASIKYLLIFELGEKGRRLHAHMLLSDVPESFLRPYTAEQYKRLPANVKKLYSQYKTETGTRLCWCPWWDKGWSTVIPVDGSPKVVSYMTKYMTKGNIEFTTSFGGHSFFSSKGLNRKKKKKIPDLTAVTAWTRIPQGAWSHSFGENGITYSTCHILDKDKIEPELWEYYNKLYDGLQGVQ